jgi:hypothetical protein
LDSFFLSLFSFFSTAVWTQGLLLAKQMLYHIPSLFGFRLFTHRVLCLTQASWHCDFSNYASLIAKITSIYHYIDGVLITFFGGSGRWGEGWAGLRPQSSWSLPRK